MFLLTTHIANLPLYLMIFVNKIIKCNGRQNNPHNYLMAVIHFLFIFYFLPINLIIPTAQISKTWATDYDLEFESWFRRSVVYGGQYCDVSVLQAVLPFPERQQSSLCRRFRMF